MWPRWAGRRSWDGCGERTTVMKMIEWKEQKKKIYALFDDRTSMMCVRAYVCGLKWCFFFLLFFAYFWCRSRYGTQLLGAKNVSATVPSCVVWQDAWMLWVVFFSLCLNTRNIHISTVHLRFHGCSLKIDELCVMFRTYYMCDRHPIYIYVDWMKLKTFRNEWARCINLCQLGLACR